MRKTLAILLCASCFADDCPLPADGSRRATGLRVPSAAEHAKALKAAIRPPRVRLAGALPSSVDNSQSPFFPPVGDQGGLGSCAQWSGIYYCLSYEYGKLYGQPIVLSPKWTYNALNYAGNNGTWYTDGWDIARFHGCATMSEFPYDDDCTGWATNVTVWVNAMYRRAAGWTAIDGLSNDAGINRLKQEIAAGRIFSFAIYIYSAKFKRVRNNPQTSADDRFLNELAIAYVSGTDGAHAMTIVGYNDDVWVDINGDSVVQPDELGAFKIANSWGYYWGNFGFVWLSYDAIRKRNAATGYGAAEFDTAWAVIPAMAEPKAVWTAKLSGEARGQLSIAYVDASGLKKPSYFGPAGGNCPFAGLGRTNPVEVALEVAASESPILNKIGFSDMVAGKPVLVRDVTFAVPRYFLEVRLGTSDVVDCSTRSYAYVYGTTSRQKPYAVGSKR